MARRWETNIQSTSAIFICRKIPEIKPIDVKRPFSVPLSSPVSFVKFHPMHPVFRCQQSPRICCSMNINHLQTVFIETCLRTSLSLPVFVLPIMSRCQLLNHHKSKLVNGPACNTHTHTHTQTKRVLINIKNTKTVSRHALKNTLQHTHTHTSPNQTSFLPSYARLPNSRHASLCHHIWFKL